MAGNNLCKLREGFRAAAALARNGAPQALDGVPTTMFVGEENFPC